MSNLSAAILQLSAAIGGSCLVGNDVFQRIGIFLIVWALMPYVGKPNDRP